MNEFGVPLRRALPRIALVAPVLLAACASGLTREEADEAFLQSNPGASEVQAGCVVDELVELYGLDGLEVELEREAALSSFQTDQLRAMFGCGLTAEVEAELVRQLAATGIEAEAAKCAGQELTANLDAEGLEVLLSGEITDTFYEKYFLALQACGGLP